jgi:hypothetical protein
MDDLSRGCKEGVEDKQASLRDWYVALELIEDTVNDFHKIW